MKHLKGKYTSLLVTITLTLGVFVALWVFNNYSPHSSNARQAKSGEVNVVFTRDDYYKWLHAYKKRNTGESDFNYDGNTDGKDYVRWLNNLSG